VLFWTRQEELDRSTQTEEIVCKTKCGRNDKLFIVKHSSLPTSLCLCIKLWTY